MALRFAVASEDFGSHLRRAIAAASRATVPGLRLNARTEVRPEQFTETALRQLLLYVEQHQMQVAGLIFTTRFSLQDPEHLDQRLDAIRKAMPLARRLGTSELIIRVGRIPDPDAAGAGTTPAEPNNEDVDSLSNPFSFATPSMVADVPSESQQFASLAELLNDLVGYGNHVGCHLQLQLSAYNAAHIRRLIDQVKSGPIGICFDPATCVMSGLNCVSTFRELHPYVGYFRVRDALKDIDGAGTECPVGDGVVDWTEMLATVAEADYPGWCCIERTGGDVRASDVLMGAARLRTLLGGGV